MANGNFVWFDLTASDPEAAKRFYPEIVGWKPTRWPESDYELWNAGEVGVGGIAKEDPRGAGRPPFWLGYAAVENVDASVTRAQKLGGKVIQPGRDIPSVGRWAVLSDPQGAVFATFQPEPKKEAPRLEGPGIFGWAELNTTDWKSAWKFYSELLGWTPTRSMSMGPELGDYFMFGLNGKDSIGGMSNTAAMMKAPAHWLYYVAVKNVDDAAKRVSEKGGKILSGPMDIPSEEGGRIAQCADPQGAMFALMSVPRST